MHDTDFGFALNALKNGRSVRRRGWDGKGTIQQRCDF